MKLAIVPTYEEIFGDEPPEFKSLIEGVPTNFIVVLISVMNAELYQNPYNLKTQIKLLQFLLKRQNQSLQNKIQKKIAQQFARRGNDNFSIFSTHLNLQFLHHSLMYQNDDENFKDTTPEQELNIFKAYLVSNSQIFRGKRINTQTDSPLDFFRKNTWPIMIGQFIINHPYNYFIALVKAKCFFDALEFETEFGQYVRNFTKRFQDLNSLNYVLRFAKTIELSKKRDDKQPFSPFSIKPDSQSMSFFNELSIDLRHYFESYSETKSNFTGLREKPLYKISKDSFAIINWNFLARKIYDGMVFDFYKKSKISKENRFKEFPAFKQFTSEKAIEKYLFTKLVKGCFKSKYSIVEFDNSNYKGHPDAYVRKGQKIFLFEIKDSLFPSKIIDSEKHELIKLEIDKKYNTDKPKKKGTHQLFSQIKRLSDKPFESKSFEELKIKARNLTIYPILIYTDPHFGLPGIGRYLEEEFTTLINSEGLHQKFKKIKKLTFMNIDVLISHLNQLQKKELTLDKLIDVSETELNKRKKRYEKTKSTDDLMSLNDNFDSLIAKYLKQPKPDGDYVKVIFNELKLNRTS